ncbi:GNAT family N-acetyltransferase [Microbacterium sp. NPDC090218]
MHEPRTITLEDPRSPGGRAILEAFFAEVIGRYWGRPATPAEVEQEMRSDPSDDLRGDAGFLLVVRDGAQVVGCGGVRFVGPGVGEVTRVYIDPAARGHGVGRSLIDELESMSARRGLRTLRLTVRSDLTEAHRLYQRLGYEPVAPFSDSPYADNQLAKRLEGSGLPS